MPYLPPPMRPFISCNKFSTCPIFCLGIVLAISQPAIAQQADAFSPRAQLSYPKPDYPQSNFQLHELVKMQPYYYYPWEERGLQKLLWGNVGRTAAGVGSAYRVFATHGMRFPQTIPYFIAIGGVGYLTANTFEGIGELLDNLQTIKTNYKLFDYYMNYAEMPCVMATGLTCSLTNELFPY